MMKRRRQRRCCAAEKKLIGLWELDNMMGQFLMLSKLFFVSVLLSSATDAFLHGGAPHRQQKPSFQGPERHKSHPFSTENSQTIRHVAVSMHQSEEQSRADQRSQRTPTSRGSKSRKKIRRKRPIQRDEDKWQRAIMVEKRLLEALEAMETTIMEQNDNERQSDSPSSIPPFPSVRDCNAALATFGDGGDFLRSLRLFLKMRKAASMSSRTQWTNVPAPTLVTYSTLMSRAVFVGRPHVALRLWNLMKLQGEFWSNPRTQQQGSAATVLMPDIKAANILMNAYAKLGKVDEAFDLMRQLKYGNGTDVPATRPNIVTYNTLIDCCKEAFDLDAALQAKQELDLEPTIQPDARTFTNLIATVARKASSASGANDPSLAFMFLEEMKSRNIRPNGMTYSALIDACGRCRRPDLALQGLRIMLRQKAAEGSYRLPNEVGAWTAAIDACGKSGRIQTARRLFSFMSNFGVLPNKITCGCLTDILLKNGKTAETLEVLRYMKREGIAPSEVMYTSLMASAEKLVEIENRGNLMEENTNDDDSTKAIEVYTELMTSLMQGNTKNVQYDKKLPPDSNLLLVKVFLIFQEMKAAGATPDIACYNVLLRACARAGDINMAKDVLKRIQRDGLHPNDTSWRELIRAAAKNGKSQAAEAMWQTALDYRGDDDDEPAIWEPSSVSFGALASAYLRDASSARDIESKKTLYKKVINMYKDVVVGNEERRLHLVGRAALEENSRSMLLILQAIVGLMDLMPDKPRVLRDLATSITQLDCFATQGDEERLYLVKDNQSAERALKVSQALLADDTALSP